MIDYGKLGADLGALVAEKQKQYGDSVSKSGLILSVLYPQGVPTFAYFDALLTVRVLDKLSRIAQRGADGQDLGGESPWNDIGGYGLLGQAKDILMADYIAEQQKKTAAPQDGQPTKMPKITVVRGDDPTQIFPDGHPRCQEKSAGDKQCRLRLGHSEDHAFEGEEFKTYTCFSDMENGAVCTRPEGHEGDHAVFMPPPDEACLSPLGGGEVCQKPKDHLGDHETASS